MPVFLETLSTSILFASVPDPCVAACVIPPPPTPTQNCLRAEMIQYRLHGSGDGHYNACLETPPELHYVYLPQALLLYCQILQYIVTAVFASTETVFFFPVTNFRLHNVPTFVSNDT